MKKYYLLAAVIAALLLATGCQKNHIAAELVDGQTFNAAIPKEAQAVIFIYNSSVSSGTVLSTSDSPVPIYGNLVGTTWRVSTRADMINANPDCKWMFKTKKINPSTHLYEPNITQIVFGKGFNTENVTSMGGMFCLCPYLESLDLSVFNTKNVTDMSYMFGECRSMKSLDLSHFNTENVTSMSCMFNHCGNLASLDLSNFNTEKVTDMSSMLCGCSKLTSIDLSPFNTKNVTSMDYLFFLCSSLTSLDLTNFNTENVTNMEDMFFCCSSLTSLDLSHFNTENVTNMCSMFSGCSQLTSLDLSHFSMNKVSKYDMCFGLSTTSKHCTITCTAAVQTELQNGTALPTPGEGVTFTWVRPTSK